MEVFKRPLGFKMKKIGLMWLIVMLVIMSCSAGFTTAGSNEGKFRDIPDNHWAREAIKGLAGKGIITGYPNGTFGPDKSVSREQFATMLVNTFGIELIHQSNPTFKDVETSRWSYPYIESSKEYLTGYFPKIGKPSFDPEGPATREDVAVALVKAMDLDGKSIDGKAYLNQNFRDPESVSPNLVNPVALAVKYNLMSGFPNGTFGGDEPINRASTAALLFKVLKSPYLKTNVEGLLSLNMDEKVASPNVSFSGKIADGAKLYINETAYETKNGRFEGVVYLDKGPGAYTYVFKAVGSDGKSQQIEKKITYESKAPELVLKSLPETSTIANISIRGTVKSIGGIYPKVYVNNMETRVYSDGSFEAQVKLSDGDNNFAIRATSAAGASTVINKKVTFGPSAPTITFYSLPTTTADSSIVIKGIVKDLSDSNPKLYVNGSQVSLSSSGDFSVPVTLNIGSNFVTFKTTNSAGKSNTVVKTIQRTQDTPIIKVTSSAESNKATYTIKGQVVDSSYPPYRDTLLINGKKCDLNYYGYFSFDVLLNQGLNTVALEATNPVGKSATQQYTVNFIVLAPKLAVTVPEKSSVSPVQIAGNVYDTVDTKPVVKVNGTAVTVNTSGNWNHTLNLASGTNTVVITAENSFGKTTRIEKSIVFTPSTITTTAAIALTK